VDIRLQKILTREALLMRAIAEREYFVCYICDVAAHWAFPRGVGNAARASWPLRHRPCLAWTIIAMRAARQESRAVVW
jgi:hypothetical protein